jgi:hypothetical protein
MARSNSKLSRLQSNAIFCDQDQQLFLKSQSEICSKNSGEVSRSKCCFIAWIFLEDRFTGYGMTRCVLLEYRVLHVLATLIQNIRNCKNSKE